MTRDFESVESRTTRLFRSTANKRVSLLSFDVSAESQNAACYDLDLFSTYSRPYSRPILDLFSIYSRFYPRSILDPILDLSSTSIIPN